MDAHHFDALARALSLTDSRRRFLALVATLPLFAGLLDILAVDNAEGRGRRKRRKKRHKHGKGQRRKHPRKCQPRAKSTTCAGGVCGPVLDNCKQRVNCGSCDCPAPCGDCKICQSGPNAPGACVADPDQVGDACGSDGQHCRPDGACACETGSCANPTPICTAGVCTGCGADSECAAAGAGNRCCAGSCFTGVCCVGGECTTVEAPDCVGHDCVCAANSNAACAAGLACCAGGCADLDIDPDHCGSCDNPCSGVTPVCAGGSCVACSPTHLCPSGECCAGDGSCGACRVFVTSTTSNGVLGSLDGADAHCQDLATMAGLPGSYKAWLSIVGGPSPATRFVQATTPYMLVDGVTQVADNWNDLVDGPLDHAINMDQAGAVVAESVVWTATSANGASSSVDCGGWTITGTLGLGGNSAKTSTEWTDFGQGSCAFADRRLYCFQQT